MDFLELTWARKSIRAFKREPIPDAAVMTLLDAARSAPSGGNCQPWRFFAIKDEAVKARIVAESCKQAFLLDAAVLFVVCADYPRTAERYKERGTGLYALQDTAAAVQNLLLCATSLGYGTCWCGAFDEAALSTILDLPEGQRPVAVIPVGVPNADPDKRPRRSVEEVTTFIGFD